VANWAALVAAIAELLKAMAWPIVVVVVLVIYRARIGSLIEVLTKKLEAATKLKAGQFEIESKEQEVKRVLEATSKTASDNIQEKIPEEQIRAAGEVERLLEDGQSSAQGVVSRQIKLLVKEYEDIRNRMSQGQQRTRRMNEVAAKMRALGLAARPLVRSLQSGQTAGERLAAICILQVAPEFGYFDWLIQRIKSEKQAFIFFQAAIAVLELVKAGMYTNKSTIKAAIEDARQHIASFRDGVPDQNTIDVLTTAISLLR
jgi:hypothetical protein